MQAMLLAAGLGTRLKPLTEQLPKPVVPVGNRPLAAFAMDRLATAGARALVANTHPRPALVEELLAAHCPVGMGISFSREQTLLGTGGGLRRAWLQLPDPNAPVMVMNGDTLYAADLAAAYRLHVEAGPVATMILRRTANPSRFGAIGVDDRGWVRQLLGSPAGAETAQQLMFTGVHVLSPEAFAALPESGCVIRSAYRRWVDTGAPVLGVVDDSAWADLGTIQDYHRINLELASGSLPWPEITPHDGNLIAPGTDVGLAKVQQSVIGADVDIDGAAALSRCVVWPGSRVEGVVTNAVITPTRRVDLS